MKHFKETFGLIFQEAIASKSKFHPELSFLGATLATLYVTLELLDQELPVREIYQNQHGQILKPKKDSTKTPRSSLVN
ncbi:MAG: hypothetical protein EOP04_09385 [Proteobacteria bacterium]|nr:MAG: hypothetical protein EOP04_09385 [Pseudomonadota bacterium]